MLHPAVIFWLLLAVALTVIEAVTVQMVSLWFAIGALATVVPSMLGAPTWVQFLVFALVSGLCVYLTRPLVKKVLAVRHVKTNADSIIGEQARVVERIDNIAGQGGVFVGGLHWTARAEDDGVAIEEGEHVRVLEIQGVKAIVERIESDI